MQSGGGGASTQSMLDWTDEQWEEIRPEEEVSLVTFGGRASNF